MSELSIQTAILKMLRRKGGLWLKLRDSVAGESEWPDIVGCYKGRFIAIEVKIPGQKPKPGQYAFLKLIKLAGGISGWCDNVDGAKEIMKEVWE